MGGPRGHGSNANDLAAQEEVEAHLRAAAGLAEIKPEVLNMEYEPSAQATLDAVDDAGGGGAHEAHIQSTAEFLNKRRLKGADRRLCPMTAASSAPAAGTTAAPASTPTPTPAPPTPTRATPWPLSLLGADSPSLLTRVVLVPDGARRRRR